MPCYRVEVATASHDDLRAGRMESRVSVVAVTAADDTEAVQLACQVAACTSGAPWNPIGPTRAELLDFPT